jgi:hypothetical protein
VDNYKNKDLASIQVGSDKDWDSSQDNDNRKDTEYDKREFEFSE